jgi:outer membrane protein assembly factor BamB
MRTIRHKPEAPAKGFSFAAALAALALLLAASTAGAQDWPQWRGPHRDGKATGFIAPKTWPKELTEKWRVTVGDGVATPALVGDKLFVFSRESDKEIIRGLNAADGKELWSDRYDVGPVTGGARNFPGPRCSPAAADGKVVTLGVRGTLSCLDAASGKVVWRKDDLKSWPMFYTSSSPIIVDGLCIAQLGGGRDGTGGIMAYDLTSGEEKWKWTGDTPAYASPVLLTLGTTKALVAETNGSVVAVNAADGKLLWKTPFASGRMQYNACTPMVDGQTVIYSGQGRGTKAVKIEKQGDEVTAKDLWSSDLAVKFNTPVVKNGMMYGISDRDILFCVNLENGKTAWTTSLGGGGGRNSGYGSVVDAGPVLFALNPSGQLIVFEPSDKEFKEVTRYKVGKSATYAYPILSGNRVFVKDGDSVTLYTIE